MSSDSLQFHLPSQTWPLVVVLFFSFLTSSHLVGSAAGILDLQNVLSWASSGGVIRNSCMSLQTQSIHLPLGLLLVWDCSSEKKCFQIFWFRLHATIPPTTWIASRQEAVVIMSPLIEEFDCNILIDANVLVKSRVATSVYCLWFHLMSLFCTSVYLFCIWTIVVSFIREKTLVNYCDWRFKCSFCLQTTTLCFWQNQPRSLYNINVLWSTENCLHYVFPMESNCLKIAQFN